MKKHTLINFRVGVRRTILVMVLLLAAQAGFSQVSLGSLSSFALFTGVGAVANTGASTAITGDIGTNSGAISGYTSTASGLPGNVSGGIYGTDAVTATGTDDVLAAYQTLVDWPTAGTAAIAPAMVNVTLVPGVYGFGGAASVGGTLTLDGAGTYIFKINGALSVGAASHVVLINGADASNVFWQVYGAATIEANSTFAGTIVAEGAISLGDGTSLNGRALATVGAITTYNNIVSNNKSTALAQATVTAPSVHRSVLATSAALTAAEVTLFPNPAHAAFTVFVPAVAEANQVQATLLNTLGQVVRQQAAALPAAGARFVVETADLAAGIYTLRLQMGTTTLAKRVVLQ